MSQDSDWRDKLRHVLSEALILENQCSAIEQESTASDGTVN